MEAGRAAPRDLTTVARACGVFAISLGGVILLGWLVGADLLIRLAPSLPAAMPNSALMFVACGVALLLQSSGRPLPATACAAFVVTVAALTLAEHATGVQLGLDNPLDIEMGELQHPGRPATHTAGAFLLLGGCLLFAGRRSLAGDLVAGILGAGAATVVGLAAAGYLIGLDYLYGRGAEHGMSLPTAFGLVVVLVGVFALRPTTPPASWYAFDGGGEAAARSLMPPALVLPFLAGALVQAGVSLDLYGADFGLSVMVVAVAAVIQGLIYMAVGAVRGHEAIRAALERESRKNVQRFTTLTREAPVGIFETDPSGRATFVNQRWVEIAGISAEEALAGRTAVHPDDRDWVQSGWREAAARGENWSAEFRFLRPDGDLRWVALQGTALRDEDGNVASYMGSLLDITDRRLAEERTALVVSRIAEAVSVIGPDGGHLHVNDAARAILDDLSARYEAGALADLDWNAVDADGAPLRNEELPAEVTRLTGEAVDMRVVGFPGRAEEMRWLRISTRTLSNVGPPYTVVASFSDITAQREDAARLAEAQRRFELAFDHAPIGVALVSLGGRLLRVNRALCEMFGYTQDELLASTFQELTDTDNLTSDLEQLRRMMDGEIASYEMEKRYAHRDGSQVWALLSVSLVRDEGGEPLHFIAQILDITERRRLERELRHLAEHDTLTGLRNRRSFGAALTGELNRERRYGGESALLMIDLDGFKEVNDTLGHAAGDLLLRAVAEQIVERVRDTDLPARLGGDEFAVLLPNTARDGAEVLAIDLVQTLRELRVEVGGGGRAGITASVGIAVSSELPDDRDEETMLAAADLAMYEAKRGGRDRYVVHTVPAR
jgi:diguanylate cyclase (GGDEF)-like protein/PAS domain S-box-containing protein